MVKSHRGPAAVIGDDFPGKCHWSGKPLREGMGKRMTREPEDLPVWRSAISSMVKMG